MKVKLYLRVAVLTAMLFTLVATFKTQPAAACSPGWYDGCMSSCSSAYLDCVIIMRAPWISCENSKNSCENNCATKLAACYNQ